MLLGQQELARNAPVAAGAPKPDRMARLASHLLQQRSLLPIFPAPTSETSPLAVDVVANLKAGHLPGLPDVLLTPSDLAPFAKIGFGGVLCVNSGRLTRKQAGGNYATISVRPPAAPAAPAAEAPCAPKAEGDEDPATTTVKAEKPEAAKDATVPEAANPAAGSPSVKVEGGDAKATAVVPAAEAAVPAPCVLPLPADAPRDMAERAFVDVKRI